MGWRFQRRVSVASGIKMNFGKRGLSSFTIGRRGASVNVGRRGTFLNLGLAGTGIGYRTKIAGTPKLSALPKRRAVFTLYAEEVVKREPTILDVRRQSPFLDIHASGRDFYPRTVEEKRPTSRLPWIVGVLAGLAYVAWRLL